MTNQRLDSNQDALIRDVVRDYCSVCLALSAQNRRSLRDGDVSYAVLNTLIGGPDAKGVFWRLKDTSHYLFRHSPKAGGETSDMVPASSVLGSLVDWCIGYAFHECCKLREDAFQGRHYAVRLAMLSQLAGNDSDLTAQLLPLSNQTMESGKREMVRILHVLSSGQQLLVRFLASQPENCSLARWLVTEEEKAREAFGHIFPRLIEALYGAHPERRFTLAADDFLDCGRLGETLELLRGAKEAGTIDAEGMTLLSTLERGENLPEGTD